MPCVCRNCWGEGAQAPQGQQLQVCTECALCSCREAHSLSPSRSGGAGGTTSCQYNHPAERVPYALCRGPQGQLRGRGRSPSFLPGEGRALGAADAGGNVTRSIPLCLDLGLQNRHMRLCPDPTPSANTNPVLARVPFLSSASLMSARRVPCSALNYLRGSAVTAH